MNYFSDSAFLTTGTPLILNIFSNSYMYPIWQYVHKMNIFPIFQSLDPKSFFPLTEDEFECIAADEVDKDLAVIGKPYRVRIELRHNRVGVVLHALKLNKKLMTVISH